MAKLKKKIATVDDLPENLRALVDELYTKQADGSYALDADVEDPTDLKKKNSEFRNNNILLKQQLSELQGKYGDLNDEELASLKALKSELENNETMQMIKAGKIDEVLAKKTATMKTQYDTQIKTLSEQLKERDTKLNAKTTRLSQLLIDTQLDDLISKNGQPREGTRDVIKRAGRDKFTVNDADQLVPITAEGDEQGNTLTPETFVKGFVKTMPHLFEAGVGGGGTSTRGTSTARQPGVKRIANDPELKGRYAADIVSGKVVVDNNMTAED